MRKTNSWGSQWPSIEQWARQSQSLPRAVEAEVQRRSVVGTRVERIPYKVIGIHAALQGHGSQSQVQSIVLRSEGKNTGSEDTASARRQKTPGHRSCAWGWLESSDPKWASQEDQWPGREHFLKIQNRSSYLEFNTEICMFYLKACATLLNSNISMRSLLLFNCWSSNIWVHREALALKHLSSHSEFWPRVLSQNPWPQGVHHWGPFLEWPWACENHLPHWTIQVLPSFL